MLAAALIGNLPRGVRLSLAAEVAIGAIVGIAGAVVLSRLAGRPPVTRPVPLLAVAVVIAYWCNGTACPPRPRSGGSPMAYWISCRPAEKASLWAVCEGEGN